MLAPPSPLQPEQVTAFGGCKVLFKCSGKIVLETRWHNTTLACDMLPTNTPADSSRARERESFGVLMC